MKKNRVSKVLLAGFSVLTLLLFASIVFLTATQTKAYAVQTDSMSPVIRKGGVAFVRNVNIAALNPGDIVTVTFNDNSGVFTHRIARIDRENNVIYTKGDRNQGEDPFPSKNTQIVGKLWFSLPLVGYLSFAAQNEMFLIALALAAIALVITGTVVSIGKKHKKGGGKNETQ